MATKGGAAIGASNPHDSASWRGSLPSVSIASAGLCPADVAERINVDPKTVERWITKGRLPQVEGPGGESLLVVRRVSCAGYLEPEPAQGRSRCA